METFIGVDIGGTEVKVALVNADCKVPAQSSFPTTHSPSPDYVAEKIVSTIVFLLRQGRFNAAGVVGVGVAGDIDNVRGIIRFSPNLGWRNVPLKKFIEKRLKTVDFLKRKTAVIENDANAAAWGAYFVDGKGWHKNLVALTLGTGVGGGIVIDGKLYRGVTGSAGEIGHVTLVPDGRLCNCGNRGCLEAYSGGSYMVREARRIIESGRNSLIKKMAGDDLSLITPFTITKAARKGDRVAKALWQESGKYLGIALAGIINTLNPSLIVLCGGVAQAGNLILLPAKQEIKKRAFKIPAEAVKVMVSGDPKNLGIIGAALLALNTGTK